MKKFALTLFAIIALFATPAQAQTAQAPYIQVNGTATLNIVPDRITVEINMEEYYRPKTSGDSILVKIAEIEADVRRLLRSVGVADSDIRVSDVGNRINPYRDRKFRMAKSLTAVLSGLQQLDRIAERLDTQGITGFMIAAMDNADMNEYNRKGLKAALDAARAKALFIAQNENLSLGTPMEIIETTQNQYSAPTFSNVAYGAGVGIESLREIVRKYSVTVKYLFYTD